MEIYSETDIIGDIRLDYPPIVEVKRQATIAISLYDLFNVSYDGAVNVTISSDATHQTQPNVLYYELTPSVIMSQFSYSVSSTYQVIVTASNLVSELSVSFTIEVVRKYSYILILTYIIDVSIRYQYYYIVTIQC